MRLFLCLGLAGGTFLAAAQESQPLEAMTSPIDFDSLRRNPLQIRRTSSDWASKNNQKIQRDLISTRRSREQDIAARAATDFPDLQEIPIRREPEVLSAPDESPKIFSEAKATQTDLDPADFLAESRVASREREIAARAATLFPDPREIPIRQPSEPLPTPNQITDEIATENYGQTSKGRRDLLSRNQLAERLNLSALSQGEYDLYVARYRAGQNQVPAASGEGLLRPMPTVINSKTGGPPHGYAVSQAGLGTRAEPRNNQNPFEDLLRALHLDQPVTHGKDSLPAPANRLNGSSPAPAPLAAGANPGWAEGSGDLGESKP